MDEKRLENNDQSNELRDILDEVNNHQHDEHNVSTDEQINITLLKEEESGATDTQEKEMDILNLPPRKEVHSLKKQRTHLKISRPFIRLTFVVILLLAVTGLLLFYGEGVFNL